MSGQFQTSLLKLRKTIGSFGSQTDQGKGADTYVGSPRVGSRRRKLVRRMRGGTLGVFFSNSPSGNESSTVRPKKSPRHKRILKGFTGVVAN